MILLNKMEDDKRDMPEGAKEAEIIRNFIRLSGEEIVEYENIKIIFKKSGCDDIVCVIHK